MLNAEPVDGLKVSHGTLGLLDGWKPQVVFSSKKSEELLGMQYRPADETIRNALVHALEKGWKQE